MSDEKIKTTQWPVPVLCRYCEELILICPVVDHHITGTYVVPLAVDASPPMNQWKQNNDTGVYERTIAYNTHECNQEKVEEIRRRQRAEETSLEEDEEDDEEEDETTD